MATEWRRHLFGGDAVGGSVAVLGWQRVVCAASCHLAVAASHTVPVCRELQFMGRRGIAVAWNLCTAAAKQRLNTTLVLTASG